MSAGYCYRQNMDQTGSDWTKKKGDLIDLMGTIDWRGGGLSYENDELENIE